jgi:hypothetical protein
MSTVLRSERFSSLQVVDDTVVNSIYSEGNVTVVGDLSADNIVAETNITATTGDITATAGDFVATAGDVTVTAGDIVVTAGDITVTAGDVNITAGDLTYGVATGGVIGAVSNGTVAANVVTTNGRRGLITYAGLNNAQGATIGTVVTVTNSEVAAGDLVSVWTNTYAGSANSAPIPFIVSTGAGSYTLQIVNAGSAALDSDVVIGYSITKAL